MKNTFNDETDEYLSIIKSIIGKDLIETNKHFGELQIIVSKEKIFDVYMGIKNKNFKPEKGNHCNWCDYKNLSCPSWED